MNRKLLITGCNGFVGGTAARKFVAAGDEVFGLDRFGEPAPDVRFVRDGVSLESISSFGIGFDAVLHFAGTGSVGLAAADPAAARHDTVDTSVAVLEYLRRHPQTKMIYASSAAVYGNAGGVLREDMLRKPISVYGELKAEVEDRCREYNGKYGCKINVVRPFSIYGKGLRKQLLWDFCNRVRAAKEDGQASVRCFGTGKEKRDFINVDDVVGLAAALLESQDAWLVLNGGTGVATSVDEVLTAICCEMGYGGELDYDGVVRPGDPETLVADVALQRKYSFLCKIDVASGIRSYVRWFQSL